jgi:hypothetical protein
MYPVVIDQYVARVKVAVQAQFLSSTCARIASVYINQQVVSDADIGGFQVGGYKTVVE